MSRKFNSILFTVFAVSVYLLFAYPAYSQKAQKAEEAVAAESAEEEQQRLTREAQMAMVEAQRAVEKKDYTTARKILNDYLATNPPEVPADLYLMLGFYWYSDDNVKDDVKLTESIKVFREGNKKFPDNFDILSYLAGSLYESQNFAEAGPMLEEVYEKSPKKELRFLEAAAGAYYQIQKYEEAKRLIRRILSLSEEPKETTYTMLIGICFEQEKFDEAEKVLFEALGKFPLNTNYWSQLGIIRQEKEDYAGLVGALEIRNTIKPPEKPEQWNEAIGLYQSMNLPLRVAKSIELSTKSGNASETEQLRIADAYSKAMKIDKAIDYLNKIISKKPSSALMLKKAEIIYNARRNKEAIAACDELIALNPNEGSAYVMKGNAAWDMEDWVTMEAAFKKAEGYKDYREYAKSALDYIQSLEEARSSVEKK